MKRQKEIKKDIIAILLYIITFLIIYIILTKNNYLFASNTDFRIQHYLIPEFFRTLFYNTHDMLPDFALNLGTGLNIYYLSYYGLLNPIIMLSYLFPAIPMIDYIILTTSITTISAVILFYFFLKKKNYNFKVRFVSSFLFLCASPIIFHTHRHIMFVNYLPFLILSIFGIDKYFEKKDISLLTISITLIILTSYYFSISSLIVLGIYYIYQYIKNNQTNFIKSTLKISIPFILGIMITSILTIPTLYTLLNGRTSTINNINILKLITPKNNILYSPYSMGLTLISVIAIIACLFNHKKENKFLSIICLLISIFPIFNYILNGTLYINSKSLIPFIPLVLLLTSEFLNTTLKDKINIKQILLIAYLITSSFLICMSTNLKDELIKKEDINNIEYKTTEELINYITEKDNTFYRINNQVYTKDMINKVTNSKEYKTTIYSSNYNNEYKSFYYNTLNNNIEYRNCFMISTSNNILSQMLLNEKYIITKNTYNNLKLIKEENGIKLYKNDNVLPLGYATSNIIDINTYNRLNYPTNILALLNNIIIDNPNIKINNNYENIKQTKIEYEIINQNNVDISKENNEIIINAQDNATIELKINTNTLNKLLLLQFTNINNPNKDLSITINNQKNTLTSKSWKYHNQNYTFHYFLYNTDTLNISLTKGRYKLNNIQTYLINIPSINNIDEFKINTNNTKGNNIEGTIDVKENSYFNLSIPYDKGFTILVDGKKIDYEKTNLSFIGFPVSKGNHNIKIIYNAPYKKISLVISIIGIILFIIYLIIYHKKYKNENFINNNIGGNYEILKKNRYK